MLTENTYVLKDIHLLIILLQMTPASVLLKVTPVICLSPVVL